MAKLIDDYSFWIRDRVSESTTLKAEGQPRRGRGRQDATESVHQLDLDKSRLDDLLVDFSSRFRTLDHVQFKPENYSIQRMPTMKHFSALLSDHLQQEQNELAKRLQSLLASKIQSVERRFEVGHAPSGSGDNYRVINIENLNVNIESLNVDIRVNIGKVDVIINLLREIDRGSIADRLHELKDIARSELGSKSIDPDSAQTMFSFFNHRQFERPVIGLGNDGMLEARWDNEDYTLNIMARFFPENKIWYALFNHTDDDYHNGTVSVWEMANLVSSHRPLAGLTK